MAHAGDFAVPLAFEVVRDCPDGADQDPGTAFGCFILPEPYVSLTGDGWGYVQKVLLGEHKEPWAALTFVPSSTGANHPSWSGQGVEISVTWEPPVPMPPGSTHRYCAAMVSRPDGSPASTAADIGIRMVGTDGTVLFDDFLDSVQALEPGECSSPLSVGELPVARIEYYLDTALDGRALDVPYVILVRPFADRKFR